jgi:LacI family transcriptional regulator
LVEAKVGGLIVMMPELYEEIGNYLSSLPMPVIFLNPPDRVKGHSSLWIDDYQGAHAATEHLIGHGYRELGIITGPAGALDSAERLRGSKDAIESSGLSLRPELVAVQDFHREGGRNGFARLMSQRKKPDAIFCCNDMMAVGAIEAARTMRIEVPGDVAIVGFDDVDISSLIMPALTTVHVPVQAVGARAVEILLEAMAALPPDRHVISEKISTGLIVRKSCGCKG